MIQAQTQTEISDRFSGGQLSKEVILERVAARRGKKVGIIPTALKALRKKLGVNQAGLAKLLRVSLSAIRSWEQARASPRKAKLARILNLQKKGERKADRTVGLPRKARNT